MTTEWHVDYTTPGWQRPSVSENPPSTEEFCGGYKGDHVFEDGSHVCRCGRAFQKDTPRPSSYWSDTVTVDTPPHVPTSEAELERLERLAISDDRH